MKKTTHVGDMHASPLSEHAYERRGLFLFMACGHAFNQLHLEFFKVALAQIKG